MDIVIFGAGTVGKEAEKIYRGRGHETKLFLDNDRSKWGKTCIRGIKIGGIEEYKKSFSKCRIIIACKYKNQTIIADQLKEEGIANFERFNTFGVYEKERLISCCPKDQQEDVILYHLLKDEKEVFYIDVGANDPVDGSVTKLFYDKKNARGINVEPLKELYELCAAERPRDINLCLGLGAAVGFAKLFVQDTGSTLVENNVIVDGAKTIEIKIDTLANICEKYVPQDTNITFLKIDVEGGEKEVLLGADFSRYRPRVIVIEATKPRTDIPVHDNWEYILFENGYEYIYSFGVNRYYIDSRINGIGYEERVEQLDHLEDFYNIYHLEMDFEM